MSADDHLLETGGVKLVMRRRQVEMLRGARVGYGREGDGAGFQFHNPNFEGDAKKKWLKVLEQDQGAD